MSLRVGQEAPDFTATAVYDQEFKDITLSSYKGKWVVLFFYPLDFTFVCPTEIAGMDVLAEHANVVGISGDNEFCKLAWKKENALIGDIKHTLAADCGLALSRELGIVHEEAGVCYRATFIFDKERTIQHASINALDTGRNADEVLRTLKALQAGGLTGCAWEEGQELLG